MNIDKSTNDSDLSLTVTNELSDKKTALLPEKTLENNTVTDCHYLNSIIRVYKSRVISKTNDSISKTNSADREKIENTCIYEYNGKKSVTSVTQRQSGESQSTIKPDLLSPVIAKYPDMADPDTRFLCRCVCRLYGFPFTLQGIEKMERFYAQGGLNFWQYLRGESPRLIPPRGMIGSGVFLAGQVTGNAVIGAGFKNREKS